MSKTKSTAHTWQFFRSGGVDQVVFRNGTDIAHLPELDQKLWMALAMPTRGVEFDPRTTGRAAGRDADCGVKPGSAIPATASHTMRHLL
jgi:hypothetical protein